MGYPTSDLIPSIKTCDHISAIVCKLFQILQNKWPMTPPLINQICCSWVFRSNACLHKGSTCLQFIILYTQYIIYNISFSNEVLTTDHLYGSNNRTIISVNLKPCIQLTSCFTGDETWSLHTSVNISWSHGVAK